MSNMFFLLHLIYQDFELLRDATKKLPNKYNNNTCQKIIDNNVVLKKIAISSRFNPYKEISNAANLPKTKRMISPIIGEKITGVRIGFLETSRTE